MKKTLLLTSMLLALTVSAALAEGVNLAWGTLCYTENPVSATTFACNTNGTAGARVMTVSWTIDVPMLDLVGLEWAIEGVSETPALPDWWKLGATPDCRAGKATFNSNYTGMESEVCVDWTAGAGFNAPNYTWTGNVARITLGTAIDAGFPYEVIPGQEYYGGGVTILNSKTVGTGACTGCSVPMVFELKMFTAAGLDGTRDDVTNTLANRHLSWNGGIVPTRNTTWGQVKGLYR